MRTVSILNANSVQNNWRRHADLFDKRHQVEQRDDAQCMTFHEGASIIPAITIPSREIRAADIRLDARIP